MKVVITVLFLSISCFLQAQGKHKYTVSGNVVDGQSQKGIFGAIVNLQGSDGSQNTVFTDSAGYFHLGNDNFGDSGNYVVSVSGINAVTDKNELYLGNPRVQFTTIGIKHDSGFIFNFGLTRTIQCDFYYPSAVFRRNECSLTSLVKDSLDIYFKILSGNPGLVVSITAYALKDEKKADKLTYERSKVINQYLISKGIKPDRIISKVGVRENNNELQEKMYGKKQPLVIISIIRKDYK